MFDLLTHSFSDRTMIALLGLLVAIVLGGPKWLHQFLWLDRPAKIGRFALIRLGHKLNRSQRSSGTLRWRSILYLLFVLLLCLMFGSFISYLSAHFPQFVAVEIGLVAYLLPVRLLLDEGLERLRSPDKQAIVFERYGTSPTDQHGMLRASIEALAIGFSRRVIAPLFFYLLLGMPVMLMVIAIHIMDVSFGSRHDHYRAFGALPAFFNRIIQFIPSRLTALLLSFSAIISPGCQTLSALGGMVKGSFVFNSSNSGAVIGAVAGALQISLGGPRFRLEECVEDGWISFGSAKVTLIALKRMLLLYSASILLLVLLVALFYLSLA